MSFIGKIFGWSRLRLSEEEIEESTHNLEDAKRIEEIATSLHLESAVVGARQRQLRAENHLGRDLNRIFRNA
ncbi:hypothetical protein SEA_EASTWEST_27 [Arthrobacter phage EastWest]|uniref:Uncharacterized protein n=1 Tax=Arthrobacter phage EastWest TaxID=2894292 RepID=A0AAE8YK32_9CAUD|nr:hypothetical protein SEA_EASTWEST_27 [Arthrobacter phage EastWest]